MIFRRFLLSAALISPLAFAVGCEQSTGEKVEDAYENKGAGIGNQIDATQDARENAAEGTADAIENSNDASADAVRDAAAAKTEAEDRAAQAIKDSTEPAPQ